MKIASKDNLSPTTAKEIQSIVSSKGERSAGLLKDLIINKVRECLPIIDVIDTETRQDKTFGRDRERIEKEINNLVKRIQTLRVK